MTYDINPLSDGCYDGTTCLINKFNITNELQLSELEAAITLAKASELEANPQNYSFDSNHYTAIHKYLFYDLYDWAGCYRTINISKKGTKFADAKDIEQLCNNCFQRVQDNNYFKDYNFDIFAEEIADLYSTLNIIHPFREGNGRTLRIYISQLIRFNGYDIDFSRIDKDLLMIATIKSAQGIIDDLIDLFTDNIIKSE